MKRRRAKSADTARRLDRLWGLTERAARGPKPGRSIDQIVASAIQIADREGLAAVTMRRVADDLGFTTMALYRYVPGKDELIDLMANVAAGTPPALPNEGAGDWAFALQAWARADLAVYQRHPWLLELIARTPQGPNWFAWVESALRALSATGLSASEMLAMVTLIDNHVRGAAQIFLGMARAERETGTPDAWVAAFEAALQKVASDQRFPVLAHVAASGGFGQGAEPSDNHFEFGLQCLLDGIDAYIRAHPSSLRRPRKAAVRRRR